MFQYYYCKYIFFISICVFVSGTMINLAGFIPIAAWVYSFILAIHVLTFVFLVGEIGPFVTLIATPTRLNGDLKASNSRVVFISQCPLSLAQECYK